MTHTRVPREIIRQNGFSREVLAAYREAVRRYGTELWVTGISISIKEVGGELDTAVGPVIAIHVRKKQKNTRIPPASRIPTQILGIPTDVIEATYSPSATSAAGSAPAVFPLRPGSSYARHNGTAATLAGVVRDEAGARHLLSTAHTLRQGGNFKKGDLMVHPGPRDSQQPVGVARYEDVYLSLDAGIARLEPEIQAINRALLSNRLILAPEMPKLLDVLEKSGRTTHVTRGVVLGVGSIGGYYPAMRLALPAGDPGPISDEGDSGSTWYDAATFAAKGLHVAIDLNSTPPAAIATLMPEIMKKMKLTWV